MSAMAQTYDSLPPLYFPTAIRQAIPSVVPRGPLRVQHSRDCHRNGICEYCWRLDDPVVSTRDDGTSDALSDNPFTDDDDDGDDGDNDDARNKKDRDCPSSSSSSCFDDELFSDPKVEDLVELGPLKASDRGTFLPSPEAAPNFSGDTAVAVTANNDDDETVVTTKRVLIKRRICKPPLAPAYRSSLVSHNSAAMESRWSCSDSGFGSQVPIRTVGSSNTTGTDVWKNNRVSSTPGFQCPGPSFPPLRSTTEHPLLSPPGYSAHRERIKQEAEESRKNYQPLAPLTSSQDNLQSSYLHQLRRRQHHSSLSAIQPGCIGLKEVESVTIQPIGRGVHDLSSRKGSTSTLRQSRRPMASSMLEGLNGVDQCGFAQQNRKDMFVSNARRTSLIDISRSVPARTERAASTSYLSSLRGQSIEDVNVTGGYHRSTKQQVTTSPPIPLRHSLHHLLQQKTPTRILASQAPTSAVQETPLTVAQKPGKELQRPVDWSSPQRNSKASPTVECTPYSPSLVEATMPSWYRLKLSRQEAIRILQQQPPGSFLVRSSTTYKDAYGLAVRSPRPLSKANRKSGVLNLLRNIFNETNAGCVRHYLIETVTNPIAGVKIKGFSAEQAFANIFELIHHHTQFPVALPCRLVLPVGTQSQQVSSDVVSDADKIGGNPEPRVQPPLIPQSSTRSGPPRLASSAAGALRSTPASSPPSITCRCLYLGAVNVDAPTGDAALAQAVDILIPGPVLQAVACDQLGATSPVQYTEGMLYVAHDQGILLTDISQKLFSHVHFSVDSFVYAGVDLREKAFIHPNHSALGLLKPRLFGFIVRNWNEGHVVHVLSEFDAINSATDVTAHINSLILCR